MSDNIYKHFIPIPSINILICLKDEETDLDRYVHGDDGYFNWTEIESYRYDGVTVFILNMMSQKWQDGN